MSTTPITPPAIPTNPALQYTQYVTALILGAESAITTPGAGQTKLNIVLNSIQAASDPLQLGGAGSATSCASGIVLIESAGNKNADFTMPLPETKK